MTQRRTRRGRFTRGSMSDEVKAKISAGQIARHQRQRALVKDEPKLKRCTKCRQFKRVPEDYVMRKRVLASGEVRHYPSGECKRCGSERKARWVQANRDTVRARQRRYNANRDQLARRAYQRDYQRMQYAEKHPDAIPRGPWKSSQAQDRELERRARVNVPAFLQWVERWQPELTDSEQRYVNRLKTGEQKTASLRVIDTIMTRNGYHHELTMLGDQ